MVITNKMKKIVISLVCICVSLLVINFSYAEDNGGVVQTEGIISFYEETTTGSTQAKGKSKDPVVVPKKPAKLLPQTGSKVSILSIMIGLLLIFVGVILIERKRKSEVDE